MTFRHPYSFVPFPETLHRQSWNGRPAGHERFQPGSLSGSLECTLTTITPLCLKAHFQHCRVKFQAPYLTGSSLKGMLRNTLQMLGYGCGGQQFVYNKKAKEQLQERIIEPLELGHMAPCTKESACLVCRLFGYGVEKSEGADDDHESFGWASKVRVFDSLPLAQWNDGMWAGMNDSACMVEGHRPARPQDQGPRHKAFYYPAGGGKPAGWKIYRHATHITEIDAGHESDACIRPKTQFQFRVEFENLTPDELSLFEFALTLLHNCPVHAESQSVSLIHKLGFGKSVGLGSCRVRITSRESLAVRRYFGDSGDPLGEPACGLQKLLVSPEFNAFRDARDPGGAERAKVLLLFPTYQEFRGTHVGSIADFDRYLNAQRLRVDPPVSAPNSQPASPPPPAGLPAQVKVCVTSIKSGHVRMETVEHYNGKLYACRIPESKVNPAAQLGSLYLVTVKLASVNHKTLSFDWSRCQNAQ